MDYSTLIAEEEEQRLSRVPLTALYEALKQVKDGRKKRGCRYSLALILTLLRAARGWRARPTSERRPSGSDYAKAGSSSNCI
jgi:hypothetical protein